MIVASETVAYAVLHEFICVYMSIFLMFLLHIPIPEHSLNTLLHVTMDCAFRIRQSPDASVWSHITGSCVRFLSIRVICEHKSNFLHMSVA